MVLLVLQCAMGLQLSGDVPSVVSASDDIKDNNLSIWNYVYVLDNKNCCSSCFGMYFGASSK